jgi:hypothetical protein
MACSGCAESSDFSGIAAGHFGRAPIHGDVAALSFHWMNPKPIRFNRCAGSVHPTEIILTEWTARTTAAASTRAHNSSRCAFSKPLILLLHRGKADFSGINWISRRRINERT